VCLCFILPLFWLAFINNIILIPITSNKPSDYAFSSRGMSDCWGEFWLMISAKYCRQQNTNFRIIKCSSRRKSCIIVANTANNLILRGKLRNTDSIINLIIWTLFYLDNWYANLYYWSYKANLKRPYYAVYEFINQFPNRLSNHIPIILLTLKFTIAQRCLYWVPSIFFKESDELQR